MKEDIEKKLEIFLKEYEKTKERSERLGRITCYVIIATCLYVFTATLYNIILGAIFR